MKKWIFVIVMMVTLSFISGCADTADAESSAAITLALKINRKKPQIQLVEIQYGLQ